jgi:hypothetical protein
LPITKDLVAVGYSGISDLYEAPIQGMILIYKDFGRVYAIEQVLEQDQGTRKVQVDAFENMKTMVCQVQLALIEGRHFRDVPKRHYMQFCQQTTEIQILIKQDLFTAFDKQPEPKKQPKSQGDQDKLLQEAMKQMSELSISMSSEIRPVDQL